MTSTTETNSKFPSNAFWASFFFFKQKAQADYYLSNKQIFVSLTQK